MYSTTGISHTWTGYITGCLSVEIASTADYHIRMAQKCLRTISSRFRGFINPHRSIDYLYNPPGKCARNVPPPKYIQMARGRHSSAGWYPGWEKSPYLDSGYKTSLELTHKPSIGIWNQPETEGGRSRCIFCTFSWAHFCSQNCHTTEIISYIHLVHCPKSSKPLEVFSEWPKSEISPKTTLLQSIVLDTLLRCWNWLQNQILGYWTL